MRYGVIRNVLKFKLNLMIYEKKTKHCITFQPILHTVGKFFRLGVIMIMILPSKVLITLIPPMAKLLVKVIKNNCMIIAIH